jgi:hypothetical protein
MKNTLSDLNNHLFAQIERLGEEDLTAEQLSAEAQRTEAITDVAKQIISNAQTVLAAQKVKSDFLDQDQELPKLLK